MLRLYYYMANIHSSAVGKYNVISAHAIATLREIRDAKNAKLSISRDALAAAAIEKYSLTIVARYRKHPGTSITQHEFLACSPSRYSCPPISNCFFLTAKKLCGCCIGQNQALPRTPSPGGSSLLSFKRICYVLLC